MQFFDFRFQCDIQIFEDYTTLWSLFSVINCDVIDFFTYCSVNFTKLTVIHEIHVKATLESMKKPVSFFD